MDDGVDLYKDNEKAEHLTRFFQWIYTREVAVPADRNNLDDVLKSDSVVLTKAIVQQELLKLKEATSPSPDEIPAKLLKKLATELAEPLCLLFQTSLDAGRLPPEWKTAWISPIYRSGSCASANNYRPGRTTDEGNVVHLAYIDFKEAFDSVPRQRLLYKLSCIGVRGKLLKWIGNFLIGRSQTVRLRGQQSAEVTVTGGVPQGSVLGSILFLIHIDDCIHGLNCDTAMFADGIKLWTVIRNEDDEVNLQANLDRLPFHVTKCKSNDGQPSLSEVIKTYLTKLDCPILTSFPGQQTTTWRLNSNVSNAPGSGLTPRIRRLL
ncbi:hypothetical protein SprV_0200579300 [Sparganum proliferum]